MFAYSNRYCNCFLLLLYGNTAFSRIEENEFYYYHRYAFVNYSGAHDNTIVRNYANSRGWYSPVGSGQYNEGNTGIAYQSYGGSGNSVYNHKFLNNIAENSAFSTEDTAVNNEYYGNISFGAVSIGPWGQGAAFTSAVENCSYQESGNSWVNNLVKDQTNVGNSVLARGDTGLVVQNFTIIAGTSNGILFGMDDESCTHANNSLALKNTVAIGNGANIGFFISSQIETWSIDYPATNNVVTTFSPAINVTHAVSLTNANATAFRTCPVFVPNDPQVKGSGAGGADIGATILYAYNDNLTLSQLHSGTPRQRN